VLRLHSARFLISRVLTRHVCLSPQHRRTEEILGAKNRHHNDLVEKEKQRHEHDQIIEEHRAELQKIRAERNNVIQASKEQSRQDKEALARINREESMHNAEVIAHARAAELNAAMFKRNEVRKVEADARERKLREKELMIAHMQQRTEERQREESSRADDYDKMLADLEREEYDLLVAIEAHRQERQELYEELEKQLGGKGSKARLALR
jgi:chromosome segregation ATPase